MKKILIIGIFLLTALGVYAQDYPFNRNIDMKNNNIKNADTLHTKYVAPDNGIVGSIINLQNLTPALKSYVGSGGNVVNMPDDNTIRANIDTTLYVDTTVIPTLERMNDSLYHHWQSLQSLKSSFYVDSVAKSDSLANNSQSIQSLKSRIGNLCDNVTLKQNADSTISLDTTLSVGLTLPRINTLKFDTLNGNGIAGVDRNFRSGTSNIFANLNGYSVDNIGVGIDVFPSALQITHCTAMGWRSQYNLQYGQYNSTYGEEVLFASDSSSTNTGFGAKGMLNLLRGDGNSTLGYWTLTDLKYGIRNFAGGYLAGSAPTSGGYPLLDSLNYCTFVGAQTTSYTNNISGSTALGWAAVVTQSNQMMLGANNITSTQLWGTTWIGTNAYNSSLILHSINVPTDHSGDGNLSIYTNDAYSIDKGGTLALGGYADTVSGFYSIFGQVSGRKENATKGDKSGYLEFDISDANGSLYRAGIFNSAKEFIIGGSTATDLGTYALQVNGNSIVTGNSTIWGTSTFDSTTSFLQAISAKEIDLTNYNNGNVFSATFSAGNPTLNFGIEQSSGNPWIGSNAVQIASSDNQAYNSSTNFASRIRFRHSFTPLVFQVAGSGTSGTTISWINALTVDITGAATFASTINSGAITSSSYILPGSVSGGSAMTIDSVIYGSADTSITTYFHAGATAHLMKVQNGGRTTINDLSDQWYIWLGLFIPFLYQNRKRLIKGLIILFAVVLLSGVSFAQNIDKHFLKDTPQVNDSAFTQTYLNDIRDDFFKIQKDYQATDSLQIKRLGIMEYLNGKYQSIEQKRVK